LDDDVELFFEHPYQETRVRAVWKRSFVRKSMVSGTQMRDRIATFPTFSLPLTSISTDIQEKTVYASCQQKEVVGLIEMFHSKYAPNINFYLDFHILNTSQCAFKLHYPFLVDLSHLYEALAGSF